MVQIKIYIKITKSQIHVKKTPGYLSQTQNKNKLLNVSYFTIFANNINKSKFWFHHSLLGLCDSFLSWERTKIKIKVLSGSFEYFSRFRISQATILEKLFSASLQS